jgi:hypothetical protein
MTVTISKTKNIVCAGGSVSLSAVSDVSGAFNGCWYVSAGGAGGTFLQSGVYTAPEYFNPMKITDVLNVDMLSSHFVPLDSGTTTITIAHPIQIFMDIFKTVLGLDDDHCVLWNQKVFVPKSDGLYIVGIVSDNKIIGNNVIPNKTYGWSEAKQYVQVCASIDVNIISRDTSALFSKEAVVMALMSEYATKQQENCGIKISTVPGSLRDVSTGDGAAIPYRYVMPCKLFYQIKKSVTPEYYDTFQDVAVTTNA